MKLELNTKIRCRHKRLVFNSAINQPINFRKMQIKGKNGSGKTTLLELIFNQNDISIDTNNIIFVRQFLNLFENLSIKDNISIHLDNWEHVFDSFQQYFPNIDPKVKVKTLSGGQKQILNLLLAFCHEADLYLIDEPLNNVDYINKAQLIRFLKQFNGSMIIVAHGENFEFCETKLVVKDRVISYEKT